MLKIKDINDFFIKHNSKMIRDEYYCDQSQLLYRLWKNNHPFASYGYVVFNRRTKNINLISIQKDISLRSVCDLYLLKLMIDREKIDLSKESK